MERSSISPFCGSFPCYGFGTPQFVKKDAELNTKPNVDPTATSLGLAIQAVDCLAR